MAHAIVVGAGAIGSHLLPHLARSSRVSRVTVIDRDRYDATNVTGQQIDRAHVRRSKAGLQARRMRHINPDLAVTAVRAAVEDVPLGQLRGSVILACLDSRQARVVVNQAAWRLGVPWIDAGIDADGLLARVRVFVPRSDAPCLECGWDQADYDVLEQAYPCATAYSVPSTRASSALGALAASLQAIECDKLLAGDAPFALVDRELLLDARSHRHYVTSYRRNPSCRMPDHDGWRITPLANDSTPTTLADVLALGSTLRGAGERLTFGVAGQRIATELRCDSCGVALPTFLLDRFVRASHPRCPQCDGRLLLLGFGLHDSALAGAVPADACDRELSALGMRPRDVITLRTPELEAHFELGGHA